MQPNIIKSNELIFYIVDQFIKQNALKLLQLESHECLFLPTEVLPVIYPHLEELETVLKEQGYKCLISRSYSGLATFAIRIANEKT